MIVFFWLLILHLGFIFSIHCFLGIFHSKQLTPEKYYLMIELSGWLWDNLEQSMNLRSSGYAGHGLPNQLQLASSKPCLQLPYYISISLLRFQLLVLKMLIYNKFCCLWIWGYLDSDKKIDQDWNRYRRVFFKRLISINSVYSPGPQEYHSQHDMLSGILIEVLWRFSLYHWMFDVLYTYLQHFYMLNFLCKANGFSRFWYKVPK